MEGRLLMRAPMALRLLQRSPVNRNLVLARHESYQSAVNPQPPLNRPFSESEVYDPNRGHMRDGVMYGSLPPKVKQLQELYQTPTGKPIWRKTAWDEFFFGLACILTTYVTVQSFLGIRRMINPKPVKKQA